MFKRNRWVLSALMIAMLAVCFVDMATAQGRRAGTPEEQKAAFDANFDELKSVLALSEDQSPLVKSVLWTAQEKRMEMMASMRGSGGAGGNLARNGMREKMQQMDEETLTALSEVLSADQVTKYKEHVAARQRGGQGRRQGTGNPQ